MALKYVQVSVPQLSNVSAPIVGQFTDAHLKEESWLEHGIQILKKKQMDKDNTISWSALHASLQYPPDNLQSTITQLLLLFYEKVATAAMIIHGLDEVHWAGDFLNPGQIPVIAFDAPLYALAKFIQ